MRLDEIDIEVFEPHKESINVGPKAELEELCNVFNSNWGDSEWNYELRSRIPIGEKIIDFTPKLALKRGTYDRIKATYTHKVLRFGIRNSDLVNLANKIDDVDWRRRNFSRELRQIQEKIWQLRSLGLHNLDNVDEILPKLSILFNLMLESKNKALKMIEKMNKIEDNHIIDDIQIFIHNDRQPDDCLTDVDIPIEELLEMTAISRLKIRIYISFKKVIINVHNGFDNSIGKLELGPIEIVADFSLLKNLNDHWTNLNDNPVLNRNGISQVIFRGINSDPYLRKHPFISSNGNWVKEMNTCTSDFDSDMNKAVYNHDYESYILAVSEWLGTYIINYTHPLNGINFAFHGEPKYLSSEFFNIVGTRNCELHSMHRDAKINLRNRLSEGDPFFQGDLNVYCNECSLIESCSKYARYNPSEVHYQLIWNYAVNYGIYPYEDRYDDDGNRITELHQLPENEQADHVIEYLSSENLGNQERMMVYERVFHELYEDPKMNELIDDQYELYLAHQKFMNNEDHILPKHRFVNWFIQYDQIREEYTHDIRESFEIQQAEWINTEDEEQLRRESEANQPQGDREQWNDDDYRAEMEEYMRNLMATGHVREAQTRRRT